MITLPLYETILETKISYYGETKAAYQFAAEEFARQMIEFNDKIKKQLPELKHTYIAYFMDVDPDTIFISQIKVVGYFELEIYAKQFVDYMIQTDKEPCRFYKYTKL